MEVVFNILIDLTSHFVLNDFRICFNYRAIFWVELIRLTTYLVETVGSITVNVLFVVLRLTVAPIGMAAL